VILSKDVSMDEFLFFFLLGFVSALCIVSFIMWLSRRLGKPYLDVLMVWLITCISLIVLPAQLIYVGLTNSASLLEFKALCP